MVLVQTRHLYILRQEVEKVFGQKVITSSDCYLLADDIFQKTKIKLSFNTLRRFFQLMDAVYPPSANTIHVFVKYCGFSSEEEFYNYKRQQVVHKEEKSEDSLLAYLYHLFKNLSVPDTNDATFIGFVHQTIDFIKRFPALVDVFQQKIAKTENGQKFYFEKFINIDKLNFFYGDGLRYYMAAKNTTEAQIFGHSLLCFKDWLTVNDAFFEIHYKELMVTKPDEKLNFSVGGHYYAAKILYAEAFNSDVEKTLIRARHYYTAVKHGINKNKALPQFELAIINALVLTGWYEEAFYYIDEALQYNSCHMPSFMDYTVFDTLQLYKAVALAKCSQANAARDIFAAINPNRFYFLSKQYHTILYLLLKQLLTFKKTEQEHIQDLIEGTGFIRLYNFIK